MIKFVWNGIKEDKTLYKAWYSKGGYTKQLGISEDTITIYARDYNKLPHINELICINETDMAIDYFEKDKIRVAPSNKHYKDVLNAFNMQQEHNKKIKESFVKNLKVNNNHNKIYDVVSFLSDKLDI